MSGTHSLWIQIESEVSIVSCSLRDVKTFVQQFVVTEANAQLQLFEGCRYCNSSIKDNSIHTII